MQAIIIVPEVVRLVCQRKPRPSVWLSKGRFARAGSREPNAERGFHWLRITLLKHPQQELPAPRHPAGEKTCAACLCPPNPVGANEHKGLRAVYGDTPKRRSGSCCWGRRVAACATAAEDRLNFPAQFAHYLNGDGPGATWGLTAIGVSVQHCLESGYTKHDRLIGSCGEGEAPPFRGRRGFGGPLT